MECPHCNHQFPLTWSRYLKNLNGKHSCPNCNQTSFMKRRGLKYRTIGLISLGFLILIVLNIDKYLTLNYKFLLQELNPYSFTVTIVTMITLFTDKIYIKKYLKLKKDKDKFIPLLWNPKE